EAATQPQPVEPERQRRQPALERPEATRDGVQKQRRADGAQPLRPLVQLLAAAGADGEVEAASKKAALPAGEPAGELVGVLGSGGDRWIGEPAALGLEPPRRFQ